MSNKNNQITRVGMVLFPHLTQLDLTGPYEVFSRMPRTEIHLLATSLAPRQKAREKLVKEILRKE